jgi:hypothetical protein
MLVRDLDFVEDGGRTYVIDLDRLTDLVALSPAMLDELSAPWCDTRRLLERLRVRPDRIARAISPSPVGAARVFELYRDGRGAPTLPGSALKGALRTMVVWALAFDFDEKTRDWVPSKEASSVLRAALGRVPEANDRSPSEDDLADRLERALLLPPSVRKRGHRAAGHDLMRCLSVGDCALREADLELARARVLTATREGPAWKATERDAKPRPRADDPQAASVGVEAMRTGASGDVVLHFDGLFQLLRESPEEREKAVYDLARAELDFEPWRIDVPYQIAIHSRNLGLAICHRERRFYEDRKLFDLARYYTGLEQQIQKAAGTDSIFTRVGWGGGWEAMTGGLVSGAARDEARRHFQLGRPGFDFPKSRKIALDGAKPASPFGWLRLDPV